MKAVLLTNEYPPHIYGGAGVHVDYLSRFMAELIPVEVRAFGDQHQTLDNLQITGFSGWEALSGSNPPFAKVLHTLSVNLAQNHLPLDADLVHCHTWYTFFAGFLAKLLFHLPLVVTMHSLEPLRPWKEEQLGAGYTISSWIEKNGVEHADRVIAVSAEMKEDILRCYPIPPEKVAVIHNGIDLEFYRPTQDDSFLKSEGIDGPYLLFVGRISRQKGILQLIEAMRQLSDLDIRLVLCASSPDTPELERELQAAIAADPRIHWINAMVPKEKVIQLYSHARLFICPSVYEPFGIINLEAMACHAPVVASRVGGIKEVVADGETGILVPPDDPETLAAAIRGIVNNEEKLNKFRHNGRERVEKYFSWRHIAGQTVELYQTVIDEIAVQTENSPVFAHH